MIGWIIAILASVILGYLVGKYLTEKIKFGEKKSLLNSEWEKKLSNLEKDYEIKLEKLEKDWQIKYIEDIGELKKLFKESEKIIRAKSVSSSRRSLVGKFVEKFVPFLKTIPYEASDMHFLGNPVDYIVFQGLHEDEIEKVTFLEVKTGDSKLTKREKSLKEAIERKKVYWKEINVNTISDTTPDREMENRETSINNLYDKIDQKISSIKDKDSNK